MNEAASVEVSSEDENYPIESALLGDEKRGWRAAEPGSQTIRLTFDSPQRLRRIWLAFEDDGTSRTQEFVLRWSANVGQPFREIVRQQWNFSSPGGVREVEDYTIDLVDVGVLELIITPDKSGGEARASLAKMRLR
ncbi:MAG: discoidin domain-containing protein [Candidatus Acidiferrum sp.]